MLCIIKPERYHTFLTSSTDDFPTSSNISSPMLAAAISIIRPADPWTLALAFRHAELLFHRH
jgi:hypothetical protein